LVLFSLLNYLQSFMQSSRLFNAIATLGLLGIGIITFFVINLAMKNHDIIDLKNLLLQKFKRS